MNNLLIFALIAGTTALAGLASSTHAQTAPIAQDAILTAECALDDLRSQIWLIDSNIEHQVSTVLAMVVPLADTKDSKTKVARAKNELIDTMLKQLNDYVRERRRVEGEVAQYTPPRPRDEAAVEISSIDAKIDRRFEQLVALSQSLAKHKDYAKRPANYYDGYAFHYTLNDDWRHSRKLVSYAVKGREDVAMAIEHSAKELAERNARLERMATYFPDPSDKKIFEEIIQSNADRIQLRERQKLYVATELKPGKETVGGKEFDAVRDIVDDMLDEIREDSTALALAKRQFDRDQAALRRMKQQLKDAQPPAVTNRPASAPAPRAP